MERNMKDSGVQWIGQIPTDWSIQKIKYILIDRKENNKPIRTDNILSLTSKQGVVPLSEKAGAGGNKPKDDLSQYRLAYPGDIVLNNMNIISGSVGLSKYFGCVSPVYYMLRPRYECDDVRYFNYVFQVNIFQRGLIGYGKGILVKETDDGKYNTIRLRLSMDALNSLLFPYPSPTEQRRIADFLDKKCAIIDTAIDAGEKELENLKNYRQELITRTVTRGLDVNVNLKDSGIKWIGLMPEQWDVIRIKYISFLKGRIGWDGLTSSEYKESGPFLVTGTDLINGEINWDTCVHITEERYNEDVLLHLQTGDVLITKDGTIGKVAVVTNIPEKVTLNSGVMLIRSNKKYQFCEKYLYYVLNSDQFTKWFELGKKPNSTILHLYQHQFENFKFTFPCFEEQKRISDYLDEKCKQLDKLITLKQQQLDMLKSYKQSIIYSYVTGKKEVSHG